MKKNWLLLLITLIFGISFLSGTEQVILAQSYPDTIRVGLYSGGSSVSSVSLITQSGLEMGYYKDGNFNILLTTEGGKQTICRKDSYFIRSSEGVTQEYNPNEGIPFVGDTFGPFHIKIGQSVPDLATAQNLCNAYKTMGVLAYPVLENGWSVWTGFYSNATLANADIPNLSSKLGQIPLEVLGTSPSRIIVYSETFEPRMIFGDTDIKLAVRPNILNHPRIIKVNSKSYRGEIELQRFSNSDMTVINTINIEEYLYGVVPKEIEYSAPLEAIKAQAVAARTYAYKSMGSYKKWDFDVVNTISSQVYAGYDDEKESSNKAVDATKGKKVLYNNRPASLFYFSSSGGMTEDNIYVWGTDIPYLKSVTDPYEAGNSYNYTWSRTFTAEDIKMKLFLSDVEIGHILSMEVEEYTPAGRARKLKIVGTKSSITYTNEDIRIILGENGGYLPSRMFTINGGRNSSSSETSVLSANGSVSTMDLNGKKAVTAWGLNDILSSGGGINVQGSENSKVISTVVSGVISDDKFVLEGKGWGHGIGMSQEGAKGFARNGYTYDQILKHYFPNVIVE